MRDDPTCYPVPSLPGYCRLLEFSGASFYFVSFQFTHKTEAGLASPSQPEQRPQQLQQPQAQQLQKLYTTTFVTPWTRPYGRSRNAFEWTLQLQNTQVSGAASSKGAWLGLGGPSDFGWKVPTRFYIEHADTWNYVSVLRTSVEVPLGGSLWLSWWSPKHSEPPYWYTRFRTEAQLLSGIPKKRCEGRYNERPSFTMVSSLELAWNLPYESMWSGRFFPRPLNPLHQWHSITIYCSR